LHGEPGGLADMLGLRPGDLEAVEGFMEACGGDEECSRADPMVVVEAVCRPLPGGNRLQGSGLYVRLAPAVDGRGLVDVVRLVEKRLGAVTGVSGRGSELRLDLDCGAGGRLCGAVRRLACGVAERLGWGTVVAAVEAVMGDGDAVWRLRLGRCELLGELDGRDLGILLRGLILAMKELGLSPSRLDEDYDVWAEWRTGSRPWSMHRRMLCYGFSFPLLDVIEGRLHVSLPAPEESEEEEELLELLGELEEEAVGRYWDNGFRISAVDPFALLRSLCPREAAGILERAGEEVVKILEATGFTREEHGVLVLGDGTLVEVNCSGYLDADNWVKIHSGDEKRVMEVAKKLLRGYYEERLREAADDNMRRVYEALLKALEEAKNIRDIVAAAEEIREAAESI